MTDAAGSPSSCLYVDNGYWARRRGWEIIISLLHATGLPLLFRGGHTDEEDAAKTPFTGIYLGLFHLRE